MVFAAYDGRSEKKGEQEGSNRLPHATLGLEWRFHFRPKPFPQHQRHRGEPLIAGCYCGIFANALGQWEAGFRRNRLSHTAMDLPALPSLDRPQQRAVRNEQPHQEAASSWLGSSPLPQSVARGRLFDGSRPPIAPASPRSKPQEAPPPIPSRSALWFRRGLRLGAFRATLSPGFAVVHLDCAMTLEGCPTRPHAQKNP